MERGTISDQKTFLVDRVLKNPVESYSKEELERLSHFRRQKMNFPVIYIGTGSCGLSAGADKTLGAVRKFISDNELEAEVVETGCAGYCSEEPIMSVQLPGKARISFRKVTADKVDEILTSTLNKSLIYEHVLCQHKFPRHEGWANIPSVEQLPFFALQQRI